VNRRNQPAKVLTIGGSDSGGAAGIQADLKTLMMFGVYGMSVLTVVTAQNSERVAEVHRLHPDLVAHQLDAVLGDYGAHAVKTGFLGGIDIVTTVAAKLEAFQLAYVVVDPVLVNHKGDSMFDESVTKATIEHLFPIATLITPNVREVELLTGRELKDSLAAASAAERLCSMGPGNVLITGIRDGNEVVDTFFDGSSAVEFRSPWIRTINRHGSGDTLSAAICALLALDFSMQEAIEEARAYTRAAIQAAAEWRLGTGHGPVSSWGNRQIVKK
jgi:hydroxymethylpyrimidine/phosphomethylpyrimidine kinase